MQLTFKSIPVIYAELSGFEKTMGEIWKMIYLRRFKPTFGHWVSCPMKEADIPKWFFVELTALLDELSERRHPQPVVFALGEDSAAVASLRADIEAEKQS